MKSKEHPPGSSRVLRSQFIAAKLRGVSKRADNNSRYFRRIACHFSRKQEEHVEALGSWVSKVVDSNTILQAQVHELALCKWNFEIQIGDFSRKGIEQSQEFSRNMCKLGGCIEDLQGRICELTECKGKLEAQVCDLSRKNENFEVFKGYVSELTDMNRDLGAQVRKLSDRAGNLEARICELTDCNGILETRVSGLTDCKQKLEVQVCILQERLCKELQGSYTRGSATPYDLECTHKLLRSSMSSCSSVFWNYAKSLKWNIDEELKRDSFPGAYLARPAHVKQMVIAKMFQILFQDFENDSFCPGGFTLLLDSNERTANCYERFLQLRNEDLVSAFRVDIALRSFCERKFRMFILSLKCIPEGCIKENAMLEFISSLIINDTRNPCCYSGQSLDPVVSLMVTFMQLTKVVWCLHMVCLSFEPRVEIFRVRRNLEFRNEYMESFEGKEEDANFVQEVGFLICPGFRIIKSIIPCQIYLAGKTESRS